MSVFLYVMAQLSAFALLFETVEMIEGKFEEEKPIITHKKWSDLK